MRYDQASQLRRQINFIKNPAQARTISIISGKGGVGKTNFAINFSISLQQQQKKVLLFDLDIGMGNVDILLGSEYKTTIVDMLNKRLPIHDMIAKGPSGLSFIAGGSALSDLFTLDKSGEDYFFTEYEKLLNEFDYIIFDMGAGATEASMHFVMAAEESIVITTPEPTAITDAYGMIKHVVHYREDMPIHVVINRAQSYKHGRKTMERFLNVVYSFVRIKAYPLGVLPEDRIVIKAVTRQTPYILLNEHSAISVAIKQITEDYLASKKQIRRKNPNSFMKRLKQLIGER